MQQQQEGAWKDVERAFGVLQARFNIVRRPAQSWSIRIIRQIMKACVILHNMIVEDEGEMAEQSIDLMQFLEHQLFFLQKCKRPQIVTHASMMFDAEILLSVLTQSTFN